jgi:hypothetical protein
MRRNPPTQTLHAFCCSGRESTVEICRMPQRCHRHHHRQLPQGSQVPQGLQLHQGRRHPQGPASAEDDSPNDNHHHTLDDAKAAAGGRPRRTEVARGKASGRRCCHRRTGVGRIATGCLGGHVARRMAGRSVATGPVVAAGWSRMACMGRASFGAGPGMSTRTSCLRRLMRVAGRAARAAGTRSAGLGRCSLRSVRCWSNRSCSGPVQLLARLWLVMCVFCCNLLSRVCCRHQTCWRLLPRDLLDRLPRSVQTDRRGSFGVATTACSPRTSWKPTAMQAFLRCRCYRRGRRRWSGRSPTTKAPRQPTQQDHRRIHQIVYCH